MIGQSVSVLVFVAALASALTAGIFYAFSSFIMGALGRIPSGQGISAMNAINVVVINPSFLVLFMGTTILCTGLGLWSLFSLSEAYAWFILAASVLFVIGCFGVTMTFNVPLNNRLAAAPPAEAGAVWQTYLREWTMWNTVRTVAPIVSAGLFILALCRQ